MRKWLFALGLILLFVGMIFASSAVQPNETTREEQELVHSETESWQISSNFTQGDKVELVITKGVDWDKYLEPPTPDEPFPRKFVWINITDPNGEETWLEATYARSEGVFGLYNVRVVASNGFDAQNNSRRIVGYAREKGLYNATVWAVLPGGGSQPSGLTFFKINERVLIIYPYSHLLYPGVAILLAGVTLSILGAITSKRVQRKRRTRAKSRYVKSF